MSDTAMKEYPEISNYGYIKDGKVYLKGYYEFMDREIGVVRESEEESIRYFVRRFDMVTGKIQQVRESIETAENKGSYLMKLIHMRTYLAQFNGLGDFTVLFEQINQMEDDIRAYVEKNRVKNTDIKNALLKEAEALKDSTDWKETALKLKDLKQKWIKTGSAYKEVDDDLTEKFNQSLHHFFESRKDYFREQARQISERLMRYRHIASQVKRINQEGSDPQAANRVKALQKEWKAIGRVPKHKFRKIAMDFKKEIEVYFNNLKFKASIKDKPVVEIKRDLLDTVERMLTGKDRFNLNTVKSVQEKWKQLGKQPNILEDKDLNLRFRIVCNELFEEHFLEKSTKYFYADYNSKSEKEQIKLRMAVLNESIRKDEKELEDYQKKHAFELAKRGNTNSPVFQERNNYVNKLKTKNRILKKLEGQLEDLDNA